GGGGRIGKDRTAEWRPIGPLASQEDAAADERGDRHRGELPVPIGGRVDEKAEIRGVRDGEERLTATPCAGEEWKEQRDEKKGEAYRAELGKRLDVETVRVPNLLGVRRLAREKPALVRACSRSEHGVAL